MTCASMDLSQGARESRPVRTKRSLPSKIFMYGVRSEMADLRRAYCAHQVPPGRRCQAGFKAPRFAERMVVHARSEAL